MITLSTLIENPKDSDVIVGMRIVLREASYTYRYAQGDVPFEDAFGGPYWEEHYRQPLQYCIDILKKETNEEELKGVLLDEIANEDDVSDCNHEKVLAVLLRIIKE